MHKCTYSIWWELPPEKMTSVSPLQGGSDRPSPDRALSWAGVAPTAPVATVPEPIRAILLAIIAFEEHVRRLVTDMGLWPYDLAPVTPAAAVVPPALVAAPTPWAVDMAREWASFGRTAPPVSVTAAPPSAPTTVVQTAPPEPTPVVEAPAPPEPTPVVQAPAPPEATPVFEEPAPNLDLARAWLLATNPLRDDDVSTDEVPWDEISADEVQRVLTVAVSARARTFNGVRPGCERDVLRDWLGSVARIAYVDPVERLRWMAALAPALARHGINDDRRDELVGAIAGWLLEVDRRDPQAVLGASAAIECIATSGIDPSGALFERAGKAWGARAWPTMRAGEAGALLQVIVAQMTAALARRDGPRARMFAHALLALAPACFRPAADRLIWFARAVAQPIEAAGLDGSAVRDVLTEGLEGWFAALPRGSTCDAAEVVLEWWSSPIGACTHEAPIARWLSEACPDPDDPVMHEPAQLPA